jgi:hypothetical protein
MMEIWKRGFYFFKTYMVYNGIVLFAYALFRTFLVLFMAEYNMYFSLMDLFIYWLLLVSFLLHFEQLDGKRESSFSRIKMAIFPSFLFSLFTSGLLIAINMYIPNMLLSLSIVITSLISLMTIFGCLYIIDYNDAPWKGLNIFFRLIKKSPLGMVSMLGFHLCVTLLNLSFLEDSGLSNYLKDSIYLNSVSYFFIYLIMLLSLLVYSIFYWLFKEKV